MGGALFYLMGFHKVNIDVPASVGAPPLDTQLSLPRQLIYMDYLPLDRN